MTDEQIRDRVFDIVAKGARVDRATLTPATTIKELKIESLDMVQILFEVEEAFDVYIPLDDQIARFTTLGELVDVVTRLVAAK
jgi:acyl carrier protein